MLKHVNSNDFEKEVLNNEKRVLVDFYADWCGPCKMISPVLEKISMENSDFDVIKVNVDDNQDLAMKYGVMSIPTLIVFDKGNVLEKTVGFSSEQAIIDLVKKG